MFRDTEDWLISVLVDRVDELGDGGMIELAVVTEEIVDIGKIDVVIRDPDVVSDADVVIGGNVVSTVFEEAANSDADADGVGDGVDDDDDDVCRVIVVIVKAIEEEKEGDVIEEEIEEETKKEEEEDEEGTNVV